MSARAAVKVSAAAATSTSNVSHVEIVRASSPSCIDLRRDRVDAVSVDIESPQEINGVGLQVRLNLLEGIRGHKE